MAIESIKQVLMRRDGLTSDEADEQIREAKEYLQELIEAGDYLEAHDICEEMFGLEPDYIMDLL